MGSALHNHGTNAYLLRLGEARVKTSGPGPETPIPVAPNSLACLCHSRCHCPTDIPVLASVPADICAWPSCMSGAWGRDP